MENYQPRHYPSGSSRGQLLTQKGVQVIAGVRSPQKATNLVDCNIEIRHLDLERHETLVPALNGIDRALLLTGYSVDMLKQSKAFLDAAKQAGVQHIVHIGGSGAPTNEVAHWGYARWSWIDCDDLALVAAETLDHCDRHAGKIYPLGYDAATMHDVAQILTDAVGKPFRLLARSPEEFLDAMLKAGGDPVYMDCVYTQLKLNAANGSLVPMQRLTILRKLPDASR